MTTSTPPPIRPPVPPAPRAGSPAPLAAATVDPVRLIKKYKWLLAGAAVFGLVFGLASHYAMLYTFPIYRPFLIYECTAQEEDPATGIVTAGGRDELERFMATQVEIMKSDSIIRRVCDDPLLRREAPKWTARFTRGGTFDTERAAEDLDFRLSANVLGDTTFIRLGIWGTNKYEATAIVESVGRYYLDNRRRTANEEFDKRKAALSNAIKETDASIEQLKSRRELLVGTGQLDALDERAGQVNRELALLDEKLIEVRATKEALQSRIREKERALKNPNGIVFDDRHRADAEADSKVVQFQQMIRQVESSIFAAQARGVGENHEDLRRLRSQLDGLRQARQAEYERVLRQLFDAEHQALKSGLDAALAQESESITRQEALRPRATELSSIRAQVADLTAEIEASIEQKQKLTGQLKDIETRASIMNSLRVSVYQRAQPPTVPSFPKWYIMMPAGLMLVFGLVFGVVTLLEIVDQRIKTASDVALITRTRVLGVVPHSSEDPGSAKRLETIFRDDPTSAISEAYRQARGTVLERLRAGGHTSLLVVGAGPGSGATSAVCNLALAMATADVRTLVIDANFRRPTVHSALEVREAPGLADVLARAATLESAVQATSNPNLHVLSAGTAGGRVFERLATAQMGEVLARASERFDIVLLDVAPATVAGDAMSLAARCDAAMLVVRALSEKRGQVARLRGELGETAAEFIGVLVNGARSAAGGYLRRNIQAARRYHHADKA